MDRLEIQLEQYRQAAEDRRLFDAFIWQNTIASVATVALGAGAVLINNVSSEVRSGALLVAALSLALMWLALFKHRVGTDTRTMILDRIEAAWQRQGLLDVVVHRVTNVPEDSREPLAYRPPNFIERRSAVNYLKILLTIYVIALLSLSVLYFGAAIEAWDLPGFLSESSGTK